MVYALAAGLVAAGAISSGCTQRRIRVTSEPAGALVWLNDRQIGRTPVETSFTYHGLYDVRLEHDGFEPVHQTRVAKAPPHEWPGLDLIAAAAPVNFSKTHAWHFVLAPRLETAQSPVELETGLLARAGAMRAEAEGTPLGSASVSAGPRTDAASTPAAFPTSTPPPAQPPTAPGPSIRVEPLP